jgi:hypothetical protein
MMYDHLCKHFELIYNCEECRKDPKTCTHEEHCESRWHYDGDKLQTLITASGICFACGKDLKLNREKMVVE